MIHSCECGTRWQQSTREEAARLAAPMQYHIAELEAAIREKTIELAKADKVIHCLNHALAEIESLCGGPGSERLKARRDIYDIARVALEQVGVPGSDLYWLKR